MRRPTSLEQHIEALRDQLGDMLANRRVLHRLIDEDNAQDVSELGELLRDLARSFDPVVQCIAVEAGLSSRSGASPYANLVSVPIMDELGAEIHCKARLLEEAADTDPGFTRATHGTLTKQMQGVA